MANCGEGWYDVQDQGVCNDYCRWVGNCGCRGTCSFWSCALAGTDVQYSPNGQYQEGPTRLKTCVLPRQNIRDSGMANCGEGWYDVQDQGVCNDYCRWVGNCGCRGTCSFWSCALAGTDVQYSPKGQYQEGPTRLKTCRDNGTSAIDIYCLGSLH